MIISDIISYGEMQGTTVMIVLTEQINVLRFSIGMMVLVIVIVRGRVLVMIGRALVMMLVIFMVIVVTTRMIKVMAYGGRVQVWCRVEEEEEE